MATHDALRTLGRFPAVLLSAAIAAVTGILLSGSSSSDGLVATFSAASLGLPLFLALALAAERLRSRSASVVLAVLGLGVLVAFAVAWPHWSQSIQVRRYAQLSLGFHLMVAFLPYLAVAEPNGFWHYNRTLFLRFLTAALYSGVLYLGLVVALVAIDKLLKIHIPSGTYPRLWIVISFIFNTWFFLGGVPADLPALESRRDYPQGLKVFSQFILIPLVAIYLAILTVYLVRILVTGQWPSGWIANLVAGVSAVGMLSLLLVHPIRRREENRWVASYARWFYVALLPAIGMLLVSIGKRIDQYGITEDRYFIAILSVWLLAIAITFIARRDTDIRVIPVTLCILAFATFFGPQGAYAVSRRSQTAHLRQILSRYGLVSDHQPRRATAPLPFEARRELSSTLAYLIGTHGPRPVRSVLGAAVPELADSSWKGAAAGGQAELRAGAVMRSLGTEYANAWDNPRTTHFSMYRSPGTPEVVAIPGVDFHVRLSGMVPATFTLEGKRWELKLDRRARVLSLGDSGRPSVSFPVDTLIAFARASVGRYGQTPTLRLMAESQEMRAVLAPQSYSGYSGDDTLGFDSMQGDLYLTLRRPRP